MPLDHSAHVVVPLLALLLAGVARAELRSQTIEYRHGEATLRGYLVYDEAQVGEGQKAAGVIVAPEWWGLNDYARRRADMLAALGYVALAADIYGEGQTTADAAEAGRLAGRFRQDSALLRGRLQAALETLRGHERVDPQRVAAIGYCFGGTAVLELARSGAPVRGVVSFHGGLGTANPADARRIQGAVLVLHGADDPLVPPDEVAAFAQEMSGAKVDWTLIAYGGAVHSFTNPDADKANLPPVRYHADADRRSWQHVQEFLAEVLRPQ